MLIYEKSAAWKDVWYGMVWYGMVWYGMDTCYSASAPCVIQLHMSVKSRWKLTDKDLQLENSVQTR